MRRELSSTVPTRVRRTVEGVVEAHVETLDGLHTQESAAKWLGISGRQLRRYQSSGELPHVRLGRLVRFRPSDLEAFAEARLVSRETVGGRL